MSGLARRARSGSGGAYGALSAADILPHIEFLKPRPRMSTWCLHIVHQVWTITYSMPFESAGIIVDAVADLL